MPLHSFGSDVSKLTEDSILTVEKSRLKSIVDSAESLIQPYIDKPGTEGYDEALKLLSNLKLIKEQGIYLPTKMMVKEC